LEKNNQMKNERKSSSTISTVLLLVITAVTICIIMSVSILLEGIQLFYLPNNSNNRPGLEMPQQSSSSSSQQSSVASVNSGYQMAYDESLGFFDDIPEEKWLRQKQIASSTIHYYNTNGNTTNSYEGPAVWYANNWHPYFHCNFEDFIGPGGDGGKWVCDPHRVNKPDCLVYSVGSNGKFEFEYFIDKGLEHCEIHIFDFTNYTESMLNWGGVGLKKSSFHAWGLGSNEGVTNIRRKNNLLFKSFRDTVQELGHTGRMIDLFKIDCEGCEWDTYANWLNTDESGILGIRQILVETHGTPHQNNNTVNFFNGLHDAGYVIFHSEPNIEFGLGKCVEFSLLKLSPSFFS